MGFNTWSTHKDRSVNRRLLVEYYRDRPRYTLEQISALSRASIPVSLLAGDSNVGYPVAYAEEFLRDLKEAEVDAELHIIPDGPDFLSASHPKEYAPLLPCILDHD